MCRADRNGRAAAARLYGYLASRSDVPAWLQEQLTQLEEQDAHRRDKLIDLRVADAIEPIIAGVVGFLNAWIDPFRTRIEALFDTAVRRPGRPRIERNQLTQRLREDGVTGDEVQRALFRFARHYEVDRRTMKKAAADL